MYGGEKLQWYEGEVEVDAERAGCFAERQLRLGLVVERATPETRDASVQRHTCRTNEGKVTNED